MRNLLSWLFLGGLIVGFVACGENGDNAKNATQVESEAEVKTLKVGATPVPAAEILEFIKPQMLAKGVDMQIQAFTDYVVPNVSLAEGSSDANMYQHKPFMDKTNEEKGYNLVALAPIYVVPLGFYSHKIKQIDELPEGANIAIPGDVSNMARAFILLHDNGVITLKDPQNLNATEMDIIENPKKLIFKPIEAASLPMVLDSVDDAVINDKTAYVNVLVAREDNKDDERIAVLKDVLLSDETRDFILEKYKGEIIPANTKE